VIHLGTKHKIVATFMVLFLDFFVFGEKEREKTPAL
jgi:hypothetical protein